ncbi:MAG: energy-coupling factor ABC transporter permease [Verrucomicrobiota bacterium]
MHMADALLSPAVGATVWAGTAGVIAHASKRLSKRIDDRKIPLMGVTGAFIFASQMINFAIPGTGSSGHLGGGMILAILLGPDAAFLVMASVLTVQAFFFADGGLLALGCNIWNLGIYPCYVAYPLIYRPLAGSGEGGRRILIASLASAVVALQLGAFSVVLETSLSGRAELPFGTFLLLMQPVHLAIGVIEGFVTAGVVAFVRSVRPDIVEAPATGAPLPAGKPLRNVLIAFLALAAVTGGALSWFRSERPDGLEWSIAKITGGSGLSDPRGGAAEALKQVQERTAILPRYGFRTPADAPPGKSGVSPRPSVDGGTTLAGLVGGALVVGLALAIGRAIRAARTRRSA